MWFKRILRAENGTVKDWANMIRGIRIRKSMWIEGGCRDRKRKGIQRF